MNNNTPRRLGMYIHTHWAFAAPYSARTWTLSQWQGYLHGLSQLGYNLVQIWPMLDTMPVPPTPSDIEHLERLRQVIRYAHDELNMTVYVGICPNTSCNEKAANYTFQDREYFEVEHLVNPADAAAMDREMERRRALLQPLAEADGLWILDCDPGGYKGSPVSDFVGIFARHRRLLDEIGSDIRLIYWMWSGWMDKHNFTPEWRNNKQQVWVEALAGLKQLDPEPWGLHACWPGHFQAVEEAGLTARTDYYPYNMIEPEPSYPLTNWDLDRLKQTFAIARPEQYPRGVLGNSQVHCLQIPHAYVFAHLAHGGTIETLDAMGFAERLIPGIGPALVRAWQAMSIAVTEPAIPRAALAEVERILASGVPEVGELAGLLFGSARRYVEDLALQLRFWAELLELRAGAPGALPRTIAAMRAWTDRHHYKKPLYERYYHATGDETDLPDLYHDVWWKRTQQL